MESVKEQQKTIDQITKALVDTISKDENVKIIIMYGSRSPYKSTATLGSDVEFIAITDENSRFEIEFIYKGIPTDLWSTTWEKVEKLAKREDGSVVAATSYILGYVVYAQSSEDRSRFEKLVNELNNGPKYKNKYLDMASDAYFNMKNYLGDLLIAKKYEDIKYAREHIWYILISSTIILGYLNYYQYRDNWGVNLHEAFQLDYKPEGFKRRAKILASSNNFDDLIENATLLVDSLRLLIKEQQIGRKDQKNNEIYPVRKGRTTDLSYVNKIRKSAKKNDILGVGYAIHDFLREARLDLIREAGLWDKSDRLKLPSELDEEYDSEFPDLHQAITEQDFDTILDQTEIIEEKLRKWYPKKLIFDNFNNMYQYVSNFFAKKIEQSRIK